MVWRTSGRLRQVGPALPWLGLAAVMVFGLLAVMLLPPLFSPDLDDPQAQFEVRDRARLTVAAIIGGVVVLVGVYINWRRVSALERQVTTLQLGQITERFTRAIDQLGAVRPNGEPAPEIRAGGVRSLERIARESDEDFWPVLDILTAYLRSESPTASPDVEALGASEVFESRAREVRSRMDVAFTVEAVGRLWPGERQPVPEPLNLAYTFVPRLALPERHLDDANLRGAYLRDANLQGASLREASLELANLEQADLDGAHLEGANLGHAVLSGGRLRGADLRGAFLRIANLQGAYLPRADLDGANLQFADLAGAVLWSASLRHADLSDVSLRGADLKDADLRGANLAHANLEGVTLAGTRHDERTQWPEGFTPPAAAE